MKYFSIILLLIYCAMAAAEPRGREFLPTVAPDDVDNPALYQEVVTPITVNPGDAPLQPNERRIIAHARPVWRVGDDGALAPIETDVEPAVETLKAVWRNDTNTVRFRVTEDGVCVYRSAGNVLRVRPTKSGTEATDGSVIANADQAKPTDTTAGQTSIIQRGSFADVRFEHVVEPGSIKETAWLDVAPPGITTARWYALVYRWDSDTLTPSIVSGDILWKTAAGKTLLRWPAPVVTDATGKELRASYRMRVAAPNLITLLVNATDLRGATYPVAVDPTTTTGSGSATASGSRCSNTIVSTLREYESTYMLITLPDMTGNTVTAAELQIWVVDTDSGTMNASIYACKNATTWNNSSTISTINSVRTGMGTVVLTNQNFTSSSAWKNLNVLGGSTNGVAKIYTDNANPGACTFSVAWPSSGRTMTTKLGTAKVGDFDAGPYTQIAQYNDATHYPRVAITYTSGGSNVGSFFFSAN